MYLPPYFFLPQHNIFWKNIVLWQVCHNTLFFRWTLLAQAATGIICIMVSRPQWSRPLSVTSGLQCSKFLLFCEFLVLIYCFHLIICRYRCQVTYRVIILMFPLAKDSFEWRKYTWESAVFSKLFAVRLTKYRKGPQRTAKDHNKDRLLRA